MRQHKDAPDIQEVIRRQVRRLRSERGWSAQQLVEAMHPYGATTTRSTLGNFENGLRADITFAEAIAMALALDVPLTKLLGDDDDTGPVRLGNTVFRSARKLIAHLGGRMVRVDLTAVMTTGEPTTLDELVDAAERATREEDS